MQPYAKIYDPATLYELMQWFVQRRGQFPETLTLDAGFEIFELPATIERYLELLPTVRENPTFGPQLHHLFRIRALLEAQGL
ncbi:MAG: hypothetical protein Q4D66_05445 [Bacteroidales bacterium]|nr:hypothetical protein [Bacteroidales bacterium]